MSRFRHYSPEQARLLPQHVRDVLSADHLCFWISAVVERLDLSSFREAYAKEGGELYDPALMLKVWLYAYALGITSSRRLEERIVEDLAFRYLAGGATPDYWALNQFRRTHARGLNDVFTQVVELAAQLRMGRLGKVAIDSTRIAANASRQRVDSEKRLRNERARVRQQIRKWQKQCAADEAQEGAGSRVGKKALAALQQRLESLPGRLQKLRKSGQKQLSRTDAEARFVKEGGRRRFLLGYSAEVAVSQDHIIVAQRVTQNTSDNESLLPMTEQVREQRHRKPQRILADSGFFSSANVAMLEQQGLDAYVPDPALAYELNTGHRVRGIGKAKVKDPVIKRMRAKLRSPAGRAVYAERKQIVEPVFGTLKEQRSMRRFRRRGLAAVAVEFTLACLAYNITRLHAKQIA